MLGKASGELVDKAGTPNVSIQIVVPAAGATAQMPNTAAFDVEFEEIGARK